MEITVFPSKKKISSRDGCTILDSAISQDIPLAHSCKNGQCGVCRATLLQGTVDIVERDCLIDLSEREILTCCSTPTSDIAIECDYFPELEGIENRTIPVKVNSILKLSNEVLEISFRCPPNANFNFLNGQYVNLIWNNNKRSYSIASKNTEDKLLIQVKKVESGLFSDMFFNELECDQLFRINGPLGTFFCRENKLDKLFLCTGTGFAPVKSMIEGLIESGFEEKIYIYWGGRNSTDIYSDLPYVWAKQYENIQFLPVYSRCTKSESVYQGYVQNAFIESDISLENIEVYACGSASMVVSAKQLLIENGLSAERFYSDAFLASN